MPEGAIKPNPQNEVINLTHNSNGKTIVKEQARSQSINLTNIFMSGHSDFNQPLKPYPTLNKTFPAGTGNEGHYHTIDNVFSPASEYYMDTAFIMDCYEHDHI